MEILSFTFEGENMYQLEIDTENNEQLYYTPSLETNSKINIKI